MAIDTVNNATSRPETWIRQSANRLNQAITWINQFRTRTSVTGSYTIKEHDTYLGLDGGHTITLSDALDGRRITIKDEAGTAGSANISIVGTVDGVSGYTINTNYGKVTLISDGTNWFTI